MKRPALALALALASFAPLAAQANTVEHHNIIGESAYGSWEYIQGNIGTFVNVVANTQTGSDACKCLSLSISQYLVDSGNVLISGVAYSENYTLSIDQQLGSATLHVVDAIFQDDSSFTFFNVDMDLTWTATGELLTQKFHDRFRLPGMVYNSIFRGTSREAVASGSVLGKNVPNRGNLQFTPVPSTLAQLQNNLFGSISVTTGSN
jgi:hypothetical protein